MEIAENTLKDWTWYSFTLNNIAMIPQISGVYCLGQNNNIIYIGSSQNMYVRLTDHYYSDDPCIKQATQFAIESCTNYKERERQQLRKFQMEHGRLPACNDRI